MQIDPDRLNDQLRKRLAPVYLISGDEPLVIQECCDAIRQRASEAGYVERHVLNVDGAFDWESLRSSSQSLSLFAERRLLEVNMPNGKPGADGGRILAELAANPAADTLLMVITGKLDKQTRESGWAKSLDDAGVAVMIWPISVERLPEWIERRIRSKGLRVETGVTNLLAYHMEGNLLAAAQEVDKLALLYGDAEVRLADVEAMLADNTRFTVFGLADSCLAGDARSAVRVLESLRAEGVEPILVLWALVREARSMAQIAAQIADGRPEAGVLQAHRVWASRRPLVVKALRRLKARRWPAILVRAARIDRLVKGRAKGNAWQEIESLVLAFCGVRVLA